MNAPAKIIEAKVTQKIGRFDKSVGAPIGSLARFHDPNFGQAGHMHSLEPQSQEPQCPDGEQPQKTYEDGVAEGRLLALAEAQNLETDIEHMLQALHRVGQDIEASHGRVIIAALTAVLPALARSNIQAEIRDFILKTSTPAMYGRVTIHAPPALKNTLVEIIESLGKHPNAQSSETGFTIEIDKTMTPNKVCANWQGGGGEVDIDAAVKTCLSMLERNYSGDRDDETDKSK
ncbi:MAG: hypothetical protein COA91_09455 [Robiginitomaculum sp.]|nr:MAG: hypothetical protein COA91_09455 [Robiginitomaculum sp.]